MMTVNAAIAAAREHVTDNPVMESSARLCLADAETLYRQCDLAGARNAALRSLRYSVGVFSPIYQNAGGGLAA